MTTYSMVSIIEGEILDIDANNLSMEDMAVRVADWITTSNYRTIFVIKDSLEKYPDWLIASSATRVDQWLIWYTEQKVIEKLEENEGVSWCNVEDGMPYDGQQILLIDERGRSVSGIFHKEKVIVRSFNNQPFYAQNVVELHNGECGQDFEHINYYEYWVESPFEFSNLESDMPF